VRSNFKKRYWFCECWVDALWNVNGRKQWSNVVGAKLKVKDNVSCLGSSGWSHHNGSWKWWPLSVGCFGMVFLSVTGFSQTVLSSTDLLLNQLWFCHKLWVFIRDVLNSGFRLFGRMRIVCELFGWIQIRIAEWHETLWYY